MSSISLATWQSALGVGIVFLSYFLFVLWGLDRLEKIQEEMYI